LPRLWEWGLVELGLPKREKIEKIPILAFSLPHH
jgi:hypothetical protein